MVGTPSENPGNAPKTPSKLREWLLKMYEEYQDESIGELRKKQLSKILEKYKPQLDSILAETQSEVESLRSEVEVTEDSGETYEAPGGTRLEALLQAQEQPARTYETLLQNSRVPEDMKKIKEALDSLIEEQFGKYNLPADQKANIKIALLNKMLKSSVGTMGAQVLQDKMKGFADKIKAFKEGKVDKQKVMGVLSGSQEVELPGSTLTGFFESYASPLVELLDSTEGNLGLLGNFLDNPKAIEHYPESFQQGGVGSVHPLRGSEWNQYIGEVQKNIANKEGLVLLAREKKAKIVELTSSLGPAGEFIDGIVEKFLKIPIIGSILSFVLFQESDPKVALEEFKKEKGYAALTNVIKAFAGNKESPVEQLRGNQNLKELKYDDLRPFYKKVEAHGIKPSDPALFWKCMIDGVPENLDEKGKKALEAMGGKQFFEARNEFGPLNPEQLANPQSFIAAMNKLVGVVGEEKEEIVQENKEKEEMKKAQEKKEEELSGLEEGKKTIAALRELQDTYDEVRDSSLDEITLKKVRETQPGEKKETLEDLGKKKSREEMRVIFLTDLHNILPKTQKLYDITQVAELSFEDWVMEESGEEDFSEVTIGDFFGGVLKKDTFKKFEETIETKKTEIAQEDSSEEDGAT